jgi:hypothetical protein
MRIAIAVKSNMSFHVNENANQDQTFFSCKNKIFSKSVQNALRENEWNCQVKHDLLLSK